MRGATGTFQVYWDALFVSIHAPRAGRDGDNPRLTFALQSFNPRAPCGARRFIGRLCRLRPGFNPRAPCGARPGGERCIHTKDEFQSTRPVRGATRPLCGDCKQPHVSIHAPRAGRDLRADNPLLSLHSFNPRAPCGARLGVGGIYMFKRTFQSTRPVRGATEDASAKGNKRIVSIHAPRAGRD